MQVVGACAYGEADMDRPQTRLCCWAMEGLVAQAHRPTMLRIMKLSKRSGWSLARSTCLQPGAHACRTALPSMHGRPMLLQRLHCGSAW